MFFPKAMTERELIVPAKDLLAVTRILSRYGVFHQTESASYTGVATGSANTWQETAAQYAALERRLQVVMQMLSLEEGEPPSTDAQRDAMVEVEKLRPAVEQVEEDVKSASDQLNSEKKRLEQFETVLHQLEPVEEIEVDIAALRNSRYTYSMLGLTPAANIDRLQTSLARVPNVFLTLRSDSAKPVVWLAGPQSNADILDRAAKSAYLDPWRRTAEAAVHRPACAASGRSGRTGAVRRLGAVLPDLGPRRPVSGDPRRRRGRRAGPPRARRRSGDARAHRRRALAAGLGRVRAAARQHGRQRHDRALCRRVQNPRAATLAAAADAARASGGGWREATEPGSRRLRGPEGRVGGLRRPLCSDRRAGHRVARRCLRGCARRLLGDPAEGARRPARRGLRRAAPSARAHGVLGLCVGRVAEQRAADRRELPRHPPSAEYDLLRVFTERPNRVLSRDDLVDSLKGFERDPFDRSIDIRVTRLRRKIETDPGAPAYVRTVRGEGYLFNPRGEQG